MDGWMDLRRFEHREFLPIISYQGRCPARQSKFYGKEIADDLMPLVDWLKTSVGFSTKLIS